MNLDTLIELQDGTRMTLREIFTGFVGSKVEFSPDGIRGIRLNTGKFLTPEDIYHIEMDPTTKSHRFSYINGEQMGKLQQRGLFEGRAHTDRIIDKNSPMLDGLEKLVDYRGETQDLMQMGFGDDYDIGLGNVRKASKMAQSEYNTFKRGTVGGDVGETAVKNNKPISAIVGTVVEIFIAIVFIAVILALTLMLHN
ncbi:MAG: conserved hypothetical protein [Methanobrevibacter sp. CfCl-M3]